MRSNLKAGVLLSSCILIAFVLGWVGLVRAASPSIPDAVRQVDAFIERAIDMNGLKASKRTDDAAFLRRVMLDLTGRIPTPEQVEEFTSRGRRHKRARLIEELIGSEEFLEHWTMFWSNLLLTRNAAGQTNRQAFDTWVSEALQQNMPYDEFVSELLTAQGSNRRNGATNFYINYNLSPVDLTAKTARTFLGVPMQCAQCHDHKTEKWTQKDFYRYAAFFSDMKREPIKDPTDENRTIGYRVVKSPPRQTHIPDGGGKVTPAFVNGESPEADAKHRRVALATFMTDPSNRYFSQAIVNRMWSYFLGKGIVEPVDGFGLENPPTHPDLLTWLADDFVRHGYDLRYLMRVILNTETYQRSSAVTKHNQGDSTYYSHALLKPLTPEQPCTAMLQTTGFERLHKRRHREQLDQLRRTYRDRFVYLFGNNDMDSQVESFSGTIPQALMMINGTVVTEGSQLVKGNNLERILRKTRTDRSRIEQIYLLVLSRKPTHAEQSTFQRYMSAYTNKRLAYEDLFWSLLNSSEFVYNH